jgi:hypothetical protein
VRLTLIAGGGTRQNSVEVNRLIVGEWAGDGEPVRSDGRSRRFVGAGARTPAEHRLHSLHLQHRELLHHGRDTACPRPGM